MNKRLKELRILLKMTQKEFGEKLGVTTSAISYLESGKNNLTERMIFVICLTFDVNKKWLETGEGEIFITHTLDEELAIYMGELLANDDAKQKKYALISLKLIVDEWKLVEYNTNKLKEIIKWIEDKPSESQMP